MLKRIRKLITATFFATVLYVVLSLAIEATPQTVQPMVSPGLKVIASNLEMARSSLVGNDFTFRAEDFDDAIGVQVSSVTIVSLPSETMGVLYFEGQPVQEGQVIRRMDIDQLKFMPIAQEAYSCYFLFSAAGSSGEFTLRSALHILEDFNFPPTLEVSGELRNNPFEFSTYVNVTHFGILHGIDPEDDKLRFEVVSQPRRGVLIMTNYQTGEFMYIPERGARGRDSFCYNVIDRFGNRSEVATVNVRINRPDTTLVYSDMDGHPAHNAAITLAAQGIMVGRVRGAVSYFEPDAYVTRGEFQEIILSAMGVSQADDYVFSNFESDTNITPTLNTPLTRAEAAVMVTRLIYAGEVAPVRPFNDADFIPAWAVDSLSTLRGAGLISTRGGYIRPIDNITRGETAEIAAALLKYFR